MDKSFLEKLSELFAIWLAGFGSIVPYPIPGNCMYKGLQAQKELDSLLQKLIDDFKSKNPKGSSCSSSGAANNDCMLGRLCYGGDSGTDADNSDDNNDTLITDRQLVTNLRFILFAGHDTTKVIQ